MSASMPALYAGQPTQAHEALKAAPVTHLRGVVRRPDKTTGRALEQVGHAIEYLIDSHDLSGAVDAQAIDEAVAILSRASRGIFATCPAVIPRKARLMGWIQQRFTY